MEKNGKTENKHGSEKWRYKNAIICLPLKIDDVGDRDNRCDKKTTSAQTLQLDSIICIDRIVSELIKHHSTAKVSFISLR